MTIYRGRANSGAILLLGLLAFAPLLKISQVCAADTNAPTPVQAAHDLIERVLPGHAGEFSLEVISPDQGRDIFELESRDGKIVLRGNHGVSLASAFNWYLKYTAKCDFSECGVQLDLPSRLPPVAEKIRRPATVPHRFMYNYCTFGYTMAWWDWPRWERELDWMAMNGINLPFILTGQEAVWINTLTNFNYSEREIRQWLGSPAHFPWTFMQNMENFGGELPASWVPQRVALARKIIDRAHALGMNVVLQGYYGMVPPEFAKRHPGVKVLPQGRWGSFKRPDMLDPTDPLFDRIAAAFMREQEKLFGRAGFYTADPFHEGGNAKGVDMTDCGRRVLSAMRAADPQAIWVKMCWQTDNAKLLADLPGDSVLALDLWAESRPYWPNGAFHGKPWIWCLLQNFGGNSELNADLASLAQVFPDALANPGKGKLSGLALTPEGHCNTPVVYALVPEFAWRDQRVELKPWLNDYLRRRYGAESTNALLAWAGLQRTIYGVRYGHETPANNIFAARPLRGEKARTWSTTQIPYDPSGLVSAWEALLAAAPECGSSDAFRYDLMDVSRQVMGDLSHALYDRINATVKAKDLPAFDKNKTLFLQVLSDLDALLATRKEFLLGRWLEDAKRWGTTADEKRLYEWQARTLITTWDNKPGSDLNDYANRNWSGLVKDYYSMRWDLYLEAQRQALASGKPFDLEGFLKQLSDAELAWTKGHQPYPTEPVGEVITAVRSLHARYGSLLHEEFPPPKPADKADVVGCWQYVAQGSAFLREFRDNGTVKSYQTNGMKLDWFDGFHWRIEGNAIIAERRTDGKVVTHRFIAPETLEFSSEGFGRARRVKPPAGNPQP
jgi:alpha-N-acetylglucosaminidase